MEKTYVIKNRFNGKIIFAFKCQSFKLCVEIAIELKKNLENADLWNANLRNANLRNADLRNTDLRNADLRNANLRNADLRNANLENADLWNANLENADLWNANLENANLWNANLRNANLRNADLENANLRNADLRNANLRNANLDFSTGISLSCKGVNIKFDRKLSIQYLFHTASNMRHCLKENKDLMDIYNKIVDLQNDFHRINDVKRLEKFEEE